MTTAPQTSLETLLARLIDRKPLRSEATLQADVRQLLLEGDLTSTTIRTRTNRYGWSSRAPGTCAV